MLILEARGLAALPKRATKHTGLNLNITGMAGMDVRQILCLDS
ncbi:hypothetical protein IQ22_03426 [Pseudomonas duriflava]|uniref:Uncharacterized protein n=1 Tax=Pseudomonas duriflava TaxID=459528 RepID=A0A562Q6D2_9PSED|nr:hypothetical protein IQ22_03426 [Pseudomonas duriflava]